MEYLGLMHQDVFLKLHVHVHMYALLFSPAKCIDHYTKLRVKRFEGETDETFIDPRLESIVNRMFQRCLHDGRYKQAVGIAIETRRIDVLQEAIEQSVSGGWEGRRYLGIPGYLDKGGMPSSPHPRMIPGWGGYMYLGIPGYLDKGGAWFTPS